ncbi:flagellar motor stator protein MotA [Pararhodospirillum oryzae]|uniref:Flagellar motor stator protein MotA n=1 Tax=Pararhodospirillum oryzae TaxID=478448 RepID=A0A512H4V4_9PROT|nr:flagellar motor stator protein MotA [Pararhodospirillum oryzae]GEO80467.1 flagellar motor stator protein MotA [Pararhodospirillum oryzae]
MLILIGTVIVIGSVMGGYLLGGGHIGVLWQPFEFMIILGAAFGAFVISNPKSTLMGTVKSMGPMMKGPRHNKKSYLELLSLLYTLFRLAKTKGDLALESHVEKPEESPIFQKFPNVAHDHHNVEFLCDYLRLLTLGTNNAHEMETIIEAEIESHHAENHAVSKAVNDMADGMPALGIVAAVLGVIHTMGSITEPPEVLGHLIGAALVGTFCGVLFSYGFFAPFSRAIETAHDSDTQYLHCMKAAILAHMQGYAPQVSIEFARKTLPPTVKPTFAEVEETVTNLSD